MIRQVKTTLRCSWCLSEAPTLITYMGDSIVKMECQKRDKKPSLSLCVELSL